MVEQAIQYAREGVKCTILFAASGQADEWRRYIRNYLNSIPHRSFDEPSLAIPQVGVFEDYITAGHVDLRHLRWTANRRHTDEHLLIDHYVIESLFPQAISHWLRFSTMAPPASPRLPGVARPEPTRRLRTRGQA